MKIKMIIIMFLLLLGQEATAGRCRREWTLLGDKCYRPASRADDFTMAQRNCQNIGAHLPIITSEVENTNVYIYCLSVFPNLGVWLGASDALTESLWHWVDGSPLDGTTFENWDRGEPNDHKGNEDCLILGGWRELHKWNDAKCHRTKPYICEMASDQGDPFFMHQHNQLNDIPFTVRNAVDPEDCALLCLATSGCNTVNFMTSSSGNMCQMFKTTGVNLKNVMSNNNSVMLTLLTYL